MHVIVSTKWLVLIAKKRVDKHKVVICTCTELHFCAKHKIISVPKNRKFQLFLTELIFHTLLILVNLANLLDKYSGHLY